VAVVARRPTARRIGNFSAARHDYPFRLIELWFRGAAVFRRSALALMGALILVVLLAAPAFAHVTVSPETAVQGSDAVLTFNVPNELDSATTTKVEIGFPADHPIADVSVLPVAGWTATVAMTKSAKPIKTDAGSSDQRVGTVTWTGGQIQPGQFEQFTVSVGLPDATADLAFPAVQTYSDGTTVRWVEPTPPGGAEPEHPAPVLSLTKTSGGSTTIAKSTTVAVPKNVATSDDVDTAKTIGIIGVVLGALGLIVAVVALLRKRTA
jgi:uncharacterized protein YcnI